MDDRDILEGPQDLRRGNTLTSGAWAESEEARAPWYKYESLPLMGAVVGSLCRLLGRGEST